MKVSALSSLWYNVGRPKYFGPSHLHIKLEENNHDTSNYDLKIASVDIAACIVIAQNMKVLNLIFNILETSNHC